MPKINLSAAQTAVETKYEDFEIDFENGSTAAVFLPALRLPKEKRKALADALNLPKRAEADNGDDIYDVYKDVFRISEKEEGDFERLEAFVGDNPGLWEHLFGLFMEDTQPGEALPSQDS